MWIINSTSKKEASEQKKSERIFEWCQISEIVLLLFAKHFVLS